jgi:hypothetical protein
MDMITLLKALNDTRITFLQFIHESRLSDVRYIDYLGNRLEDFNLVQLDYTKPIYIFSDSESLEIMVTNMVCDEFLEPDKIKGFMDSLNTLEEYPNLYFIAD